MWPIYYLNIIIINTPSLLTQKAIHKTKLCIEMTLLLILLNIGRVYSFSIKYQSKAASELVAETLWKKKTRKI